MTDILDQVVDTEPSDKITRRDLAEGKIGKVIDPERTSLVPIRDGGGLKFENAFQMAEAARLMATAGPLLPEWLQGNVGGCWAIILRSSEIGISPLTLAAMSFVTEKKTGGKVVQRIGWDSSYFRTLVEMYAPIKGRLDSRYSGEGDDLVCTVFATFKGETEPRQFPPKGTEQDFTLKKLHPGHNDYGAVKGSPLWDEKPPLQLFYAMSRDWARMYCTDIVAGVYTREELIESGFDDVTRPTDLSPRLRERLRGPVGEGFQHGGIKSIEESIAEATPTDTRKRKTGAESPAAGLDPGSSASGSEPAPSVSTPAPADGAALVEEKAS